jgi:hypothetical protein
MATKTITIRKGQTEPEVNPFTVDVSIKAGDDVEWKCGEDGDFLVCFDDTPFDESHFHKARKRSGPIKITLKEGEKYCKYSVEINGQWLDPGIIVRP